MTKIIQGPSFAAKTGKKFCGRHLIKKLLFTTLLAANTELACAQISLKPETVPLPNIGALSTDDLGPVFAHPEASSEASSEASNEAPPPMPLQTAKKEPSKHDIMSLFQDDKPKGEEKNPLEEQAKNEMQAMDNPADPASMDQPPVVQLGEGKTEGKTQDLVIKAENAPKEMDLENMEPEAKG